MAFPPPHLKDKYEILEKIHQGGMGEIYTARHLLLDEIRVIKVVRLDMQNRPGFQARFRREARAYVRLRHPNIALIHDFSQDRQGAGYLEMELIEGVNLLELVKKHGALPPPLVVEIAIQSLGALDCLHREGFVHRDVSPDNFMIAANHRGEPTVKLIDLGLAKVAESSTQLTMTGVFLGKLPYASPEHFGGPDGKARIETRSDLYSFGVVLYKLLTDELPIPGRHHEALIAGHLVRPPRDFAETDPDGMIPVELRELVLEMLAKRVEDRPRSAHELALAFERVREIVGLIDLEEVPRLIDGAQGARTRPFASSEALHSSASDMGQLVRELEVLLEERAPDALEALLDKLSTAVAKNPRVVAVRAGLARLRSQEKHLDDARVFLDQGDSQAAEGALEVARNLDLPSDRLEALKKEAYAARRAHATRLLDPMEELVSKEAWGEARATLASVSKIDPENTGLVFWAERLEHAEILSALRRHLDAAELGKAYRTLEKARALGVPDTSLRPLEDELAGKERREETRSQLRKCLVDAHVLLDQGNYQAAEEVLEKARSFGVPSDRLAELEEEASGARRAHATELLDVMEGLVGRQAWSRGRKTLASVSEIDPEHPELGSWMERLEREIISAARRHLNDEELDKARHVLEEARALGDSDTSLRPLADELAGKERREEARVPLQAETEVAEARELARAGRWQKALARLDWVVELAGSGQGGNGERHPHHAWRDGDRHAGCWSVFFGLTAAVGAWLVADQAMTYTGIPTTVAPWLEALIAIATGVVAALSPVVAKARTLVERTERAVAVARLKIRIQQASRALKAGRLEDVAGHLQAADNLGGEQETAPIRQQVEDTLQAVAAFDQALEDQNVDEARKALELLRACQGGEALLPTYESRLEGFYEEIIPPVARQMINQFEAQKKIRDPAGHTTAGSTTIVFKPDAEAVFAKRSAHLIVDWLKMQSSEQIRSFLTEQSNARLLITGFGSFGGSSLIRGVTAELMRHLVRRSHPKVLVIRLDTLPRARAGAYNLHVNEEPAGIIHDQMKEAQISQLVETTLTGDQPSTATALDGHTFGGLTGVFDLGGALGAALISGAVARLVNQLMMILKGSHDDALLKTSLDLLLAGDSRQVILIVDRIDEADALSRLLESALGDNLRHPGLSIVALARREAFDCWPPKLHVDLKRRGFREQYVRRLWDLNLTEMLGQIVEFRDADDSEQRRHLELWLAHLAWVARGSIALALRQIKSGHDWTHQGGELGINPTDPFRREKELIEHNAHVQAILVKNWPTIRGSFFNEPVKADKVRIGLYQIVDWMRTQEIFDFGDLCKFSKGPPILISRRRKVREKTLGHLLGVLEAAGYLRAQEDGSFELSWRQEAPAPDPTITPPRQETTATDVVVDRGPLQVALLIDNNDTSDDHLALAVQIAFEIIEDGLRLVITDRPGVEAAVRQRLSTYYPLYADADDIKALAEPVTVLDFGTGTKALPGEEVIRSPSRQPSLDDLLERAGVAVYLGDQTDPDVNGWTGKEGSVVPVGAAGGPAQAVWENVRPRLNDVYRGRIASDRFDRIGPESTTPISDLARDVVAVAKQVAGDQG